MKITLFALMLVLSFIPAKAQKSESSKQKSEIPTVAYCELLRHPNLYVGKVLRFRALYTSVYEMSTFSCSDCKGDEYMAWVEFDDGSVKSSTKPETHKKFRDMMTRHIDDIWVIFNTELLVTGILDNSKAGYGHLGMYRFLVTVKSIEEIGETKKIDLEKR
jgi:hypothetical protein